ncbi:MAG TPA: hypothetical protein VM008_18225 [Phycisphaerae bacterium]|nr:hypothetical protein [Phycisphaerae bacterium]
MERRERLGALARVAGAVVALICAGARADILYVSNYNNQTIDKVMPDGSVSVFVADPGDLSVLCDPEGLAFDGSGNLYVSNPVIGTIEKITPQGVASTYASGLYQPTAIASDKAGNLYVANGGRNTIEKISPSGSITTVTQVQQGYPYGGLAVDSAGNLYAQMDYQSQECIRKITPGGSISTFTQTYGIDDGGGLAFDPAGNLYFADTQYNLIQEFTPSGVGSVFANTGLSRPTGLAFDSSGYLYVSNAYNDSVGNTIVRFSPDGSSSVFASGLSEPMYLAVSAPEPGYSAMLGIGAIILAFGSRPRGDNKIAKRHRDCRLKTSEIQTLEQRALFSVYVVPGWATSEEENFTVKMFDLSPQIQLKLVEFIDTSSANPEWSGIPPADSNNNLVDTIAVDGRAGLQTLTLDFSNGAFSHAINQPDVVILGSGSALRDTLVIVGDGNDAVMTTSNSILFTDSTGYSTTIRFDSGVSNIVFENVPEQTSGMTVAAGVALLLVRRDRKRAAVETAG